MTRLFHDSGSWILLFLFLFLLARQDMYGCRGVASRNERHVEGVHQSLPVVRHRFGS
jgi:hypothetical protein